MQKLPRQTPVAQLCPTLVKSPPQVSLSLAVSMKPVSGGFAFPGVLSFLVDPAYIQKESYVNEV